MVCVPLNELFNWQFCKDWLQIHGEDNLKMPLSEPKSNDI